MIPHSEAENKAQNFYAKATADGFSFARGYGEQAGDADICARGKFRMAARGILQWPGLKSFRG